MRPLLIFQAGKLVWPATSTSEMCACRECYEGESEKLILLEPYSCLIAGVLQNISDSVQGFRIHSSKTFKNTIFFDGDIPVQCLVNVSGKKEKDDTEKQTRINTMNRPSSQISLGFLGSWAMPHTAMWYSITKVRVLNSIFLLHLCQRSHLCCWAITVVLGFAIRV